MKKKNICKLTLGKITISHLGAQRITGGATTLCNTINPRKTCDASGCICFTDICITNQTDCANSLFCSGGCE
jgi:hypothetical protein